MCIMIGLLFAATIVHKLTLTRRLLGRDQYAAHDMRNLRADLPLPAAVLELMYPRCRNPPTQ